MTCMKRTIRESQPEMAASPSSEKSLATIKHHIRGRMENNKPNQVDVYIGERIRIRRTLLGLSQEAFAKQIGVTFQQVQKYENGRNRVGGSRLFDITRVLGVDMNYLIADISDEAVRQSPMMLVASERKEQLRMPKCDIMQRGETLRLVMAYYRVKDRNLAKNLLGILEKLPKKEVSEIENL